MNLEDFLNRGSARPVALCDIYLPAPKTVKLSTESTVLIVQKDRIVRPKKFQRLGFIDYKDGAQGEWLLARRRVARLDAVQF